jgi:hypothetical protein
MPLPRVARKAATSPQVVDAENMVGVGMGVEHGIDPRNILAHGLRVKIRSGVDEHDLAVILKHDGRPRPPVVRIARVANGAVASQRGHAH